MSSFRFFVPVQKLHITHLIIPYRFGIEWNAEFHVAHGSTRNYSSREVLRTSSTRQFRSCEWFHIFFCFFVARKIFFVSFYKRNSSDRPHTNNNNINNNNMRKNSPSMREPEHMAIHTFRSRKQKDH